MPLQNPVRTSKALTGLLTGPELANRLEFRPEDFGAVGDGVTDDTVAVQAAIDAAIAVNGVGTVLFGPKKYLLNGAPRHDRGGNAIVALPNTVQSIKLLGTGAAGDANEFMTRLISTRTGDTYSGTWGSPSVLGGPTEEQVGAGLPTVGQVTIDGIVIELPSNPDLAGLDLVKCAGARLTEVYVRALDPSFNLLISTKKHTFGIRWPSGNYGLIYGDGVYAQGFYAGMVIRGSHTHLRHVLTGNNVIGLALVGGDGHASVIDYAMVEHCNYVLAGWDPVTGAKSLAAATPFYLMSANIDIEDGAGAFANTFHVLDANNQIIGPVTFLRWGGLAVVEALTISGAGMLDYQAVPSSGIYRRFFVNSGPHSARMAQTGYPGRMWTETDTKLLYAGVDFFGTKLWTPIQNYGLVAKTADESVNNSAVLQNDDHLLFPVEASELWQFDLLLDIVGVSATADLQLAWALPAGATVKWGLESAQGGVAVAAAPTALSTGTITAGLLNGEIILKASGFITVSTTVGVAQLQWAQNTATVENVTVKRGSVLKLLRVI